MTLLLQPLLASGLDPSFSLAVLIGAYGSVIATALLQFIQIYLGLLTIRVLLTWFPTINWSNPVFSLLSQMTDPYLNLFRGILPAMGGLDFSPWLAFLVLIFAQQAIIQFA
ncbi:MAG: YggT family protein [Cyanobacteriota bacterium]|nr:YggT family protein [Cyanobacteriota bacterium]